MPIKALKDLSDRAVIASYRSGLLQFPIPPWIEKAVFRLIDPQPNEKIYWSGEVPKMELWKGPRKAQNLTAKGIELTHKEYQVAVDIQRSDLEHDRTGNILRSLAGLGVASNELWLDLLIDLMVNGESTVCYDGSYFFHTAHSELDSGTQDNDLTYTAADADVRNITVAEAEEAIYNAIIAIMLFKSAEGRLFNRGAKDFIVLHPASVTRQFEAACERQMILESGASRDNTLALSKNFSVTPVPVPDLDGETNWSTSTSLKFVVLRVDRLDRKPFIISELDAVNMSKKAKGSEYEHDTRRHQYGVDVARGTQYGQWQHAVLTTVGT